MPLSLVTSLFFLWAIGVHLNDILIPHFKSVFHLNDFESSLIQSAFFGGYFLAAFPAARLMEKFGYKKGILIGLMTCAAGALTFIPAAFVHAYPLFLCALFIMACGQSFLEVASNPYIALLGPPERSAMRLNIAQAFNAAGAVLTPFVGVLLILGPAERAAGSGNAASEARILAIPYIGMVVIYLCYALVIYRTNLPEVQQPGADFDRSTETHTSHILKFPHLLWGVLAQFFYVGAQVGVASFVIRLAEHKIPGLPDSLAAHYLRYHLIGFMVGRIFGSVLLQRIPAAKLLSIFGVAALIASGLVVFGSGFVPVWSSVAIGACNSIMFPTIFALSIKGLGRYTKIGSSLLVMAIVGGAILPAIMGLISDASDIQRAFLVPLASYVVVVFFALFGYREKPLPEDLRHDLPFC